MKDQDNGPCFTSCNLHMSRLPLMKYEPGDADKSLKTARTGGREWLPAQHCLAGLIRQLLRVAS